MYIYFSYKIDVKVLTRFLKEREEVDEWLLLTNTLNYNANSMTISRNSSLEIELS